MSKLNIDIANNRAPSQQDIAALQTAYQQRLDTKTAKKRFAGRVIVCGALLCWVFLVFFWGAVGLFPQEIWQPFGEDLFFLWVVSMLVSASGVILLILFNYKPAADKRQLQTLDFAETSHCVEIQKWLMNPAIAAYRDTVVRQGRRFINAEVAAMKAYFGDNEQRKIDDEACRNVYLQGLAH